MLGFTLGPPLTLIEVSTDTEGKLQINTTSALTTAQFVAIALSESEVFRKTLTWNVHLTEEEIRQGLRAYFADFPDPLIFDFQRLDDSHIMVIATSLETIQKHCAEVPHPLHVGAVDHESYAIARALKKTGKVSHEQFGFYYSEQGKIKTHFFDRNHLTFYEESDKKDLSLIEIENKSYLLALGLALRNDSDWNVLPKPAENPWRMHARGIFFLLKCTIFSIALWAFAHIALTGLNFSQTKYNQFLTYELKKEQTQSSTVQSQKTQIKTMQEQLHTLDTLKQQQQPSLILLKTLSHVMPDGTFLTQLSFQNNHIQLMGLAVTEEQTKTLLKNLSEAENIENLSTANVQADNTEPPYHFSFGISATLRSHS